MTNSTATQLKPIARALIICDDPDAIEALTHCMQQLAVAAEVCLDASKAGEVLAKRKIEAIVVDARMGDISREIVRSVRASASNKKIVLLAIADGDYTRKTAMELGASFVFEPPFSTTSVESLLRAAYGMIVRERRRYFRAIIECPVYVKSQLNREVCCSVANISEGGMSIVSDTPLAVGEELTVRLTLPQPTTELHSSVVVRWCDSTGRAGLQFVSLFRQPDAMAALQEWLGSRLEASFPVSVASKFQSRA